MKATKDKSYGQRDPVISGRSLWLVLLIGTGIFLSPAFACVTPFAALAALAASKLERTDSIMVVGLIWASNQAIGYGVLGYPRTWESAAWGLAIGASFGLAVMTARWVSSVNPVPLAASLPLVTAISTFEFVLYVAGFVLPDSEGAFTASVVGHVIVINAIVYCSLLAVSHLARISRLSVRRDEQQLLTFAVRR